ncbi:efflux RND transporter periplasmic adaptor subunit [Stappia indica]|nr:efflux RND transporter periplasmic adaptor subunit [Stappia indica]
MLKSVDDNNRTPRGEVAFERPQTRGRSAGRTGILAAKLVLQAVIALAVLIAAYVGMNRLILAKDPVPVRPARETAYIVETTPVEMRDHAPMLSLYGEVTAARTAELRTLVAGEIIRVNPALETGSIISSGEELLAVDPFQYEGAVTEARANLVEARAALVEARGRVSTEEGNVERAREQLEFAQRDLQRAEQLLGSGSVTERTVDERRLLVSQRGQALEQRRYALDVEKARVDQQQAAIDRLQWRLSQAERNLADTVLKAPFDAVVRSENAAIGRLVGVNDVVATLYARDALEVRFSLSDNQYGRILSDNGTVVGRPVEVLWHIGGQPVAYRGEIRRIGAEVALARGGIDVYASVTVADGQPALRPGAFVELRLADRTYPASARIPEGAIYGTDHVFVVDEENRTRRRDIEVLAFDGTHVIVSGDLATGDRLVSTRLDKAGEGLLVSEPRNRGANTGG